MPPKKKNSNAVKRRFARRGGFISKSVFEFMELPVELRVKVYEYVLAAPNHRLGSMHNIHPLDADPVTRPIVVVSKRLDHNGKRHLQLKNTIEDQYRFDVSILCTSHQVYAEAKRILLKINTFHFAIFPDSDQYYLHESPGADGFTNSFIKHFPEWDRSSSRLRLLSSISVLYRSEYDTHNLKVTTVGDATLAHLITLLDQKSSQTLKHLEIYFQAGYPIFSHADDCNQVAGPFAHLTAAALEKFLPGHPRCNLRIGVLRDECSVECNESESAMMKVFLAKISPSNTWKESRIFGEIYSAKVDPVDGYRPFGALADPCGIFKHRNRIWVNAEDQRVRSFQRKLAKVDAEIGRTRRKPLSWGSWWVTMHELQKV